MALRTRDRIPGSTKGKRRDLQVVAASLGGWPTTSMASQTRTCVRCGRHTTFVLDDPAGGWYSCVACGRYA